MSHSEDLLIQLKSMLAWKKSKKFYAEKLQITEDEVNELIKDIKKENKDSAETFIKDAGKLSEEVEFIKKVNNDIYKLLKTLNMDSETRRLFNTSIINNGRDKLVNDSFKSLFYDAMTNATGFYRFRFLKYGNVKLDVLE